MIEISKFFQKEVWEQIDQIDLVDLNYLERISSERVYPLIQDLKDVMLKLKRAGICGDIVAQLEILIICINTVKNKLEIYVFLRNRSERDNNSVLIPKAKEELVEAYTNMLELTKNVNPIP